MARGASGVAVEAGPWQEQASSGASPKLMKRAADEQEAGRGMKALAPTLVFNASEMELTGVFWIEE